jgi:hypothetical protein
MTERYWRLRGLSRVGLGEYGVDGSMSGLGFAEDVGTIFGPLNKELCGLNGEIEGKGQVVPSDNGVRVRIPCPIRHPRPNHALGPRSTS